MCVCVLYYIYENRKEKKQQKVVLIGKNNFLRDKWEKSCESIRTLRFVLASFKNALLVLDLFVKLEEIFFTLVEVVYLRIFIDT